MVLFRKKVNYKLLSILFLGVLLVLGILFLANNSLITGNTISLDKGRYFLNQPINGEYVLSLKEGELIPEDSIVKIEYADFSKEYSMNEFIELTDSNVGEDYGKYYVENAELSGEGFGFGKPGESITYPEIYFKFRTLIKNQTNETEINLTEINESEINETEINISEELNQTSETNETIEIPEGNQTSETNETIEIPEGNQTQESEENLTEEPEQPTIEENNTQEEPIIEEPVEEPTEPPAIPEIPEENPTETPEELPIETTEPTEPTVESTTETGEITSGEGETTTTGEGTGETTSESETQSESQPQQSNQITGNFLTFFAVANKFIGIWNEFSISEFDNESHSASVSKESSFYYTLEQKEEFEIIEGSIGDGNESLSENILDLEKEGDKIKITTDYSKTEFGFGKNFLGKIENYNFNLNNLNISINETGNYSIKISVLSSGNIIDEEKVNFVVTDKPKIKMINRKGQTIQEIQLNDTQAEIKLEKEESGGKDVYKIKEVDNQPAQEFLTGKSIGIFTGRAIVNEDLPEMNLDFQEIPSDLIIQIDKPTSELQAQGIITEIIAVESELQSDLVLGESTIRLEKINLQPISNIIYCSDWNIGSFSCNSEWIDSNLTFIDNGTYISFNVTHFTAYAGNYTGTSNTTNLKIWDNSDSITVYKNTNNTFYANYTNSTSNESINGTDVWCEFRENSSGSWSSIVNMTFNATSRIYELSKNITNAGTFSFNVSCFNTRGYDNLTALDNFTITEIPGCIGANYVFTCGDTVNQSCTMNGNLSVNGTCFTIGASNIVVDGNDYTLTGNRSGEGFNILNYNNVTIKNCQINSFYSGILFNSSNNSLIYNNSFDLNGKAGIFTINSKNNNITKNLNTNTTSSCTYYGSQHCVYANTSDESGIALCSGSSYNGIEDFTLRGNNTNNGFGSDRECGVDSGISIKDNSNNNTIYNVTLYYPDTYGILISTGSNNTNIFYLSVYGANSIGKSTNDGIIIGGGSSNNNVSYNEFYSCNEWGIFLAVASNQFIYNNTVKYNSNVGIRLGGQSDNNTIINNIVTNNGQGIRSEGQNNTISNNNVSSNDNAGIILTSSGYYSGTFVSKNNKVNNNKANSNNQKGIYLINSSNNTLTNNTAKNNTIWAFYSITDSLNNIVTNLEIGSTVISFESKDIALKNSTVQPNDPANYKNIGTYFNITNTSTNSWLSLNMSYRNEDLNGIDESSLRLWKYNNSWNEVSNSMVNITKNYIYSGNITSFSIFAPLGKSGCVGLNYTFVCNQTINQSCTMNGNLNSNGTCFTIGANNLVIDGNGYTLTGNNSKYITLENDGKADYYLMHGVNVSSGIGINVSDYNNITIKDFQINKFYVGVLLNSSNNSIIYNNIFDDNGKAEIFAINSNNNNFTKNYGTNTSSSCQYLGGTHCVYSDTRDESGIALCNSSSNNWIRDFTLYGNSTNNGGGIDKECGVDSGISIRGAGLNNTIYDITLYYPDTYGILIYDLSHNTNISHMTLYGANSQGKSTNDMIIQSENTENLSLANSYSENTTEWGPFIDASINAYLENVTVKNATGIGFRLSTNSSNIRIKNSYASGSTSGAYGYGIILENATNAFIQDSSFLDNLYDIRGQGISNATFLNASYNKSKVSIINSATIYFKWYLDAYVNYTNGTAVEGAFVTAYNNANALTFNATTNNSGYIERQNVTEYYQTSSGKTYYTNYSVNATKETRYSQTELINLTGNYIIGENGPVNLTLGAITMGCIGTTTNFTCGDTITESCTMNGNLTSSGKCFTIGTGNIIVDCNNYILTGNRSGEGFSVSDYNDITIKNCQINSFYSGILFNSSNNSLIYNNTFDLNGKAGIFTINSNNNNITKNLNTNTSNSCDYQGTQHCVYANPNDESGIALCDSSNNNWIEDFTLYGNNTNDGGGSDRECGVDSGISLRNNCLNNTIYNVTLYYPDTYGVLILGLSHNTNISYLNVYGGNSIGRSTNDGIIIGGGSSNNNIGYNEFYSCNEWGIFLAVASNQFIYNNTVKYNSNVGIRLGGQSDNNTIINNIVTNNGQGIRSEGQNNTISNNNVSSNDNAGIILTSSGYYSGTFVSKNNKVNNNTANSNDNGISISGSNNYLTNNTANTNGGSGIEMLFGSNYNTLSHITANNNLRGVHLIEGPSYNIISNLNANNNFRGIEFNLASDNIFIDSKITNSTEGDILHSDEGLGTSNTFLNVSFNKSNVQIDSGIIYVKWYLDAYVNYTNGTVVESANVTFYDNINTLQYSALTNSSGYILRQNVTEYSETDYWSGGKTYYTNYSVNATKNQFISETDLVNLTGNYIVGDLGTVALTLRECGCDTGSFNYTCGETITQSCTMNCNLTATGTCFTIGADNITVDSAGYWITGDGTGDGIYLSGYTNNTITNFGISGFEKGMYLDNSYENIIRNNTLTNNAQYQLVLAGDSENNTIQNLTLADDLMITLAGKNINVNSSLSINTFPTRWYNFSKNFAEITNNSVLDYYALVSFRYNDSVLNNLSINESSLSVWGLEDDGTWLQRNSTVNTTDNILSMNDGNGVTPWPPIGGFAISPIGITGNAISDGITGYAPATCTPPNPAEASCTNSGCSIGETCNTMLGCNPSSCACSGTSWICLDACTGGECIPLGLSIFAPLGKLNIISGGGGTTASCGDGSCNGDETCSSCSSDCGTCYTCGNNICEATLGETLENCPSDCCVTEGKTSISGTCCSPLKPLLTYTDINNCIAGPRSLFVCTNCGNGVCGAGENICNCLSDCNVTNVTLQWAPKLLNLTCDIFANASIGLEKTYSYNEETGLAISVTDPTSNLAGYNECSFNGISGFCDKEAKVSFVRAERYSDIILNNSVNAIINNVDLISKPNTVAYATFADRDLITNLSFYKLKRNSIFTNYDMENISNKPYCDSDAWLTPDDELLDPSESVSCSSVSDVRCSITPGKEGWYVIKKDGKIVQLTSGTCTGITKLICPIETKPLVKYKQRILKSNSTTRTTNINWIVAPADATSSSALLTLTRADYVAEWNPGQQNSKGAAYGVRIIPQQVISSTGQGLPTLQPGQLALLPLDQYYYGQPTGSSSPTRLTAAAISRPIGVPITPPPIIETVLTGSVNIVPGKPYFVSYDAAQMGTNYYDLIYIGDVPSPVTFEFNIFGNERNNYLTLPFNTTIKKASQLCNPLVGGIPIRTDTVIETFNSVTQTSIQLGDSAICQDILDYPEDFDFDLIPGKVYRIQVTRDASWTQR